jgi:hypothetical protein
MSLVNRNLSGDIRGRGHALLIDANNESGPIDFGTPGDIDLRATPYKPGDRVLIVMGALRGSTNTNTLAFSVQDAPDNAGSIGTPAAATVYGTPLALATDSGAGYFSAIVGVKVKPGRPWIRVNLTHAETGTDPFHAFCHVLGIANGV